MKLAVFGDENFETFETANGFDGTESCGERRKERP